MKGWRTALRIARRDALRHRGRSILVLVMVALPVLAVSAAAVVIKTSQLSGAEGVDRRMGAAAARVWTEGTGPVLQAPDPQQGYTADGAEEQAEPLDAAVVTGVLGPDTRLLPIRQGWGGVRIGERVVDLDVTEVDLADPMADGLFELTSGRLPRTADEVVANQALLDKGVALGDELDLGARTATVVGVGRHVEREVEAVAAVGGRQRDVVGAGGAHLDGERDAPVAGVDGPAALAEHVDPDLARDGVLHLPEAHPSRRHEDPVREVAVAALGLRAGGDPVDARDQGGRPRADAAQGAEDAVRQHLVLPPRRGARRGLLLAGVEVGADVLLDHEAVGVGEPVEVEVVRGVRHLVVRRQPALPRHRLLVGLDDEERLDVEGQAGQDAERAEADAGEVVQEAFISAWRSLDTFRGDSSIRTWLFRLVHRRAVDLQRHRRPTPIDDELISRVIEASGDNPLQDVLDAELLEALQRALDELPWNQRAAWLLREVEGLGYEEIARTMGTTVGSVRGHLHRGRRQLAERMARWR
ncbi:hypothetical protein Pve01_73630 [Planomonospora venezuelensis]|nr:hypothetical protein Pve01_73630 [Planomonospora venezuelensis]